MKVKFKSIGEIFSMGLPDFWYRFWGNKVQSFGFSRGGINISITEDMIGVMVDSTVEYKTVWGNNPFLPYQTIGGREYPKCFIGSFVISDEEIIELADWIGSDGDE